MKAVNDYGDSDYSEELQVAVAPLPSKPVAPTKDQTFSTTTSIKLNWLEQSDTEPAVGYKLYIKGEEDLVPTLLYDGSKLPSIYTYNVINLSTGASFAFTLSAVNFNGEGPVSNPAVFTACTAPSGLDAPEVMATSETTIDLQWQQPVSNGGCALIGYELYMDNGLGGAFVSTDDAEVKFKPYLKSHQVTKPSTDSGKAYRIYLRAVNQIGYVDSKIIKVIQSDVPPKPSAAPTTDLSLTNAK